MARFAWVKVAVEMPRDHKLYTRPLVDRHLFTCLLCHAQEHFPDGVIRGASAGGLNSLFNLGGAAKVEAALQYFVSVGIASREGDTLTLLNFEKRQARAPEDPENVRERQRRHREALRGKPTDESRMRDSRDGVRDCHAEEDEEEDREEETTKALSAAPTHPLALLPEVPSPVEQVEAYYRGVMGKTASWIFKGTIRERKVKARLAQGYTVEQICRGIDGCKRSPYHQGQNESGTFHNDLELICREATKLDAFIGMASAAPGAKTAQQSWQPAQPKPRAPSAEQTLARQEQERALFASQKKLSPEEIERMRIEGLKKAAGGAHGA